MSESFCIEAQSKITVFINTVKLYLPLFSLVLRFDTLDYFLASLFRNQAYSVPLTLTKWPINQFTKAGAKSLLSSYTFSVSSVENHIKLLSSEIERHHPQRRYWGGFGSAFLLFTTTEPLSIHELCIFGMCIKVNTVVEI